MENPKKNEINAKHFLIAIVAIVAIVAISFVALKTSNEGYAYRILDYSTTKTVSDPETSTVEMTSCIEECGSSSINCIERCTGYVFTEAAITPNCAGYYSSNNGVVLGVDCR